MVTEMAVMVAATEMAATAEMEAEVVMVVVAVVALCDQNSLKNVAF
jgi:hypothetical protein